MMMEHWGDGANQRIVVVAVAGERERGRVREIDRVTRR